MNALWGGIGMEVKNDSPGVAELQHLLPVVVGWECFDQVGIFEVEVSGILYGIVYVYYIVNVS